jgi:hypothetical protein
MNKTQQKQLLAQYKEIHNQGTAPQQPSESALRRKAFRRGYRLTKLRENSRWFNEHGPYMIARLSTNGLEVSHMTLQEAAEWIANAENIT